MASEKMGLKNILELLPHLNIASGVASPNVTSTKESRKKRFGRKAKDGIIATRTRQRKFRDMKGFYLGYRNAFIPEWKPLDFNLQDGLALLEGGELKIIQSSRYASTMNFARSLFYLSAAPEMRTKVDNTSNTISRLLYINRNNTYLKQWQNTVHYCAVWTNELNSQVKVYSFKIEAKADGESMYCEKSHLAVVSKSCWSFNGVTSEEEFIEYVYSIVCRQFHTNP